MDCDCRFGYGTLRRGADTVPAHRLAAAAVCLGAGAVRGALYSVGAGTYPGLVIPPDGRPAAEVVGDLYRVDASLLRWLDDYEGIQPAGPPGEYRRTIVSVRLPGQLEPVRAWTYEYLLPGDATRRIASGDWLNRVSS